MVKFGRHLNAFLAEEVSHDESGSKSDDSKKLYVVPYTKIRDAYIEYPTNNVDDSDYSPPPPTPSDFRSEFRRVLALASSDFERHTADLWRRVFDGIGDDEEARGAIPDRALRMYISRASRDDAEELLVRVRRIHAAALTNAEALRKLVKKFDKRHAGKRKCGEDAHGAAAADDPADGGGDENEAAAGPAELSRVLLPEVYSANFTVGQPTLEAGLGLLRHCLGMDVDDEEQDARDAHQHHDHPEAVAARDAAGMPAVPTDDTSDLAARGNNNSSHPPNGNGNGNGGADRIRLGRPAVDPHSEAVDRRRSELTWLRSLVASVAPDEMRHLVSHRGFHSVRDRSDRRPLENSLTAYESAWVSGVHLCECDVALTKDERLILAHDEDLRRLALDPNSPLCHKKVTEMTFREIMACPLKTGSRPPLLLDVLRSARAIGGESRLIIEIKPGNSEAGTALARLFMRHPELMDRCAVVMSFDAFAIHTLRREMVAVERAFYGNGEGMGAGAIGNSGASGLGLGASAVGGSLLSFPTAMSLGNLGVMPHVQTPHYSEAEAEEEEEKKESSSVDASSHPLTDVRARGSFGASGHFGVGLSDSRREDSFHFSPFGAYQNSLHPPPSEDAGREEKKDENKDKVEPPAPEQEPVGGEELRSSHNFPPRLPSSPRHARGQHHRHPPPPRPPRPGMPHLLLLTVSDPPQKECELELNVADAASRGSRVDSWVHSSDGSLHGLYLQFQKEMLEPDGLRGIRDLTDRGYLVGVWGHNGRDPDDYRTFHRLVREAGVSFVNSDLPRRFKMGEPSAHRGVSFGL